MPEKLNVLLVVPWDQESGGVAAVVGYLARHLEGQGHRVLFLNPGSSESVVRKTTKWGFPGVELKLRVPFNPAFPRRSVLSFLLMFPLTMFRLARLIVQHDIRLVNVHYPGEQFIYFAVCRWLMRIRLVVSIHGTDAIRWAAPSARPSRTLRMLYRAADLIIAPSWRFLRRCDDVLSSSPARRLAIHNGTDVAELELSGPDISGIDEPYILSVCSLDPWKGVDVLIRAAALLRDAAQPVRIVVAGEGPQRVELERLIADLGLQDAVHLIGKQPHPVIAKLMHRCSLFVLASRFETFGIAALEAMACGKTVIGTAVDGILEIVEDGENGFVVPPDDPSALAGAIHVLLEDKPLRERLGAAARARVREQFQRDQMGDNYLHAFREVLTSGA
ncbi:MAG TPA: glycosyltransferase family 4 protein [Thermoanaerobaculia bacterium]|nr:glycosyltransferase family 4 protein [Thermoanaerobaculia bacterium]